MYLIREFHLKYIKNSYKSMIKTTQKIRHSTETDISPKTEKWPMNT